MTKMPFPFPLKTQDVIRRRATILTALYAMDDGFANMPVRSLSSDTLYAMLHLYDEQFFSCFLCRTYGELCVTLSARLISSAGKFIYSKTESQRFGHAEIRMSSDFLFRLTAGPFLLNGLSAATAQEAFLIIFEHELCHAAETALYGDTGHSKRFLALANGLFGHTDTQHSLPTRSQDAAKSGLTVGSRVSFSYGGKRLYGILSYVGKTGTVMVPFARGEYCDRSGTRYTKYRVSLSLLQHEP